MRNVFVVSSIAAVLKPGELDRTHVYRRVSRNRVLRYDELFEHADVDCLREEPHPERFVQQMAESHAEPFMPRDHVARYGAGIRELDVAASA